MGSEAVKELDFTVTFSPKAETIRKRKENGREKRFRKGKN